MVSFAGPRFEWDFVLAKVDFAIVGADFLKHFKLVVDLLARQLLDATTLHQFPAAPMAPGSLRLQRRLEASMRLWRPLRRNLRGCLVSFKMLPTTLE